MHELLLSAVHNGFLIIGADSRTCWLTSILCWFNVTLAFRRRILLRWNRTATFIKSIRWVYWLFHHLCMTALLYHIAIVICLLLMVLGRSSIRLWLTLWYRISITDGCPIITTLIQVIRVCRCSRWCTGLCVVDGAPCIIRSTWKTLGIIICSSYSLGCYASIILHIYYKLNLLLLIATIIYNSTLLNNTIE